MIQHDFYRSVGSKAVGSSEIRLQSVVETLHGAERDLTARLEPVEDEGLVRTQHAGDLPHRLDTRAQGLRAPLVHEFRRPGRGDVLPEELELLLQKVGADGPQVAGEQLLELDGLIGGEVLRALQQAPTRVRQHDLLATCSASSADLAGLLRSHVIERLVHLRGDVVAVEDIQGALGPLGDHVQIRLPHVRADKADQGGALGAEPEEEFPEARLFAILCDEQQPLHAVVDLVDQGEESAFAPVDLIDPAGGDASQVHARPTPVDRHLYRAIHALPAGLEGARNVLPGQQLRPGGQEPREARRQLPLAQRPRQMLDHDSMLAAAHPPRRIAKVRRDTPQRYELKLPLGQPVVAGHRALTLRAGAAGVLPRSHPDLDPRYPLLDQSARLVHEALQPFHTVQQSLQHKMHRQSRSAKLPPWESSIVRSSPRARPAPSLAHARSAAAPRSSASSPPTPCISPGNWRADASMCTGWRWINAATAAPSPRPTRARRKSNAARRPASSSSANSYADRPPPPQTILDVLPACASPGRASWHLPVPKTALRSSQQFHPQILRTNLFFKALKQNLKIKTFVGTSPTAVKTQVWTALITMLMLRFMQLKSRWGWSMSNLVALLRMNLFTHRELWAWLDNPFAVPPDPPGPEQVVMAF